jgi:GNAT superfamily N-acetyltransferase
MTTIAPLAPADREDWLRLWHEYLAFYETVLPAEVTEATFARLVRADPARELHGAVARDAAGRAIGLVHWLEHPSTWTTATYCYLEDLYIDPTARGAGAGRALIAHVRDWAAARGCAKVYWLTRNDNATARALYDRVAEDTGFVHYEIALG